VDVFWRLVMVVAEVEVRRAVPLLGCVIGACVIGFVLAASAEEPVGVVSG
jgi:hypothetical protein